MPHILLDSHYGRKAFSILESYVPPEFSIEQTPGTAREQLIEAAPRADFIIASGRAVIDSEVLDAADKLKMVSRVGVGIDMIDVGELAARDIALCVNVGVNASSVAEHTILLTLACLRKLIETDEYARTGEWASQAIGIETHELAGKTACVIGMGAIGSKVAKLFRAFDCKVLECTSADQGQALYDRIGKADIVSLHCASTNATRGMVDSAFLARMKPGSILINTARGNLIVEEHLVEALDSGRLFYAGLDVRQTEPPSESDSLAACNRTILTPHIAGLTAESFHAMMKGAVDNIIAFEAGNWEDLEKSLVPTVNR